MIANSCPLNFSFVRIGSMMGNNDYLSGGYDMVCCADLPRTLCYEKLDKKIRK